jgi:hypothetical protein
VKCFLCVVGYFKTKRNMKIDKKITFGIQPIIAIGYTKSGAELKGVFKYEVHSFYIGCLIINYYK